MAEEQFPQGELLDLGTLAASNIVQALGLPKTSISIVREALTDEIQVMTNHFSMTIMDMKDQIEKAQPRPVRAWEKPLALGAVAFALIVGGFLLGVLV